MKVFFINKLKNMNIQIYKIYSIVFTFIIFIIYLFTYFYLLRIILI